MASNTHKYVAKEGSRNFFCCRAPHGARGLKLAALLAALQSVRRAPHGARGLKHDGLLDSREAVRSRPARGAWIETRSRQLRQVPLPVAPRTGRVD